MQLLKYSKALTLKFLFLIIFTGIAHSQDSLLLSEQWKQLKVTLERRSDLVSVMRKELSKSGADIRREADSAVIYSQRLFAALNQQVVLNQPAIDSLVRLNRNLTSSLGRTFVLLEQQPDKIKEKILPYLAQLERVENRIHVAIRHFNVICLETDRPECRFQLEVGEDRAPQVRF